MLPCLHSDTRDKNWKDYCIWIKFESENDTARKPPNKPKQECNWVVAFTPVLYALVWDCCKPLSSSCSSVWRLFWKPVSWPSLHSYPPSGSSPPSLWSWCNTSSCGISCKSRWWTTCRSPTGKCHKVWHQLNIFPLCHFLGVKRSLNFLEGKLLTPFQRDLCYFFFKLLALLKKLVRPSLTSF